MASVKVHGGVVREIKHGDRTIYGVCADGAVLKKEKFSFGWDGWKLFLRKAGPEQLKRIEQLAQLAEDHKPA